jgi:hypothetical protein
VRGMNNVGNMSERVGGKAMSKGPQGSLGACTLRES